MCPQVLFRTFGENNLVRLKCKESRSLLRAEHQMDEERRITLFHFPHVLENVSWIKSF